MSLHRACCCNPSAITCNQWCACLPDEVHITLGIVDSYYYKCGPDIMSSFDESLIMADIQLLKTGCTMVSTDGGTVSYGMSQMTKQHKPYCPPFVRGSLALCLADPCMACTGADLCTTESATGGGTSVAGDLQISCFDPCGNTPAIAHSRLDIQPYVLTANNQSEYGPCGTTNFNFAGLMRAYGALVGAEGCLDSGTWKRFFNYNIVYTPFAPSLYPPPSALCNSFDRPECDFLSPSKLFNWNHDFSITCTDTTTGCGTYATCFYPPTPNAPATSYTQCLYPAAPPTPVQVSYYSRTINVNMSVP